MNISPDRPGRTIGGLLVLQTLVAQMLAEHPGGRSMFDKMKSFPLGLEPDRSKTTSAEFGFLADVSAGAQDTLDAIEHNIGLIGGFRE